MKTARDHTRRHDCPYARCTRRRSLVRETAPERLFRVPKRSTKIKTLFCNALSSFARDALVVHHPSIASTKLSTSQCYRVDGTGRCLRKSNIVLQKIHSCCLDYVWRELISNGRREFEGAAQALKEITRPWRFIGSIGAVFRGIWCQCKTVTHPRDGPLVRLQRKHRY